MNFLSVLTRATEECLSPPPPPAPPPTRESLGSAAAFDPSDDGLLLVRVRVRDVDDSPPRFSRRVFTGGIATDGRSDGRHRVGFGDVFMRLSATDGDVGENARMEFGLDGPVVASVDSEGLEDIR